MNIPKELVVSISGIRGITPNILSEQLVYAFAYTFSSLLPPGPILVSRDSRASGIAFKKIVIQAFASQGRAIIDADLVPLPTTQIAIKESHCVGGVDITASHNPIEYNGLKFLDDHGIFIRKPFLDKLCGGVENFKKLVEQKAIKPEIKSINEQAIVWHLARVKNAIISGRKLIVAVDAVNGAGSIIVPKLLSLMNCEIIPLAVDPMAPFPHVPEPTPTNLAWTQNKLKNSTYDLCVIVDPDADRLVLMDETGVILSEELTLPLVAEELLLQGRKGAVVTNMSTSKMIDTVAEKYGAEVIRSAVGEINVVEKMQEVGAFFGGEGNGGVIDPQVHYGRDSVVGIVNIINLMRRKNMKLSELRMSLDKFVMRKIKVPISEHLKMEVIEEKIKATFPDANINTIDGIRLDWKDTWIHIRPSNTEPILRIIGEGTVAEEIDGVIEKAKQIINSI